MKHGSENHSNQPAANDHWNDAPFEFHQTEKHNDTKDNGEPINGACNWKKNVQREPDSQIKHHTDDRGSDGGKRAGEVNIAAHLLNVRRAEENPEETRNECCPCRDASAERGRDER